MKHLSIVINKTNNVARQKFEMDVSYKNTTLLEITVRHYLYNKTL